MASERFLHEREDFRALVETVADSVGKLGSREFSAGYNMILNDFDLDGDETMSR